MRIAGFSESSKFWTHIALPGYPWEYACISVRTTNLVFFFPCSRWRICQMWSVLRLIFELTASPLKCTELYFSLLEKCGVAGCEGCPCDQSAIGLSAMALMEEYLIRGMISFGWTGAYWTFFLLWRYELMNRSRVWLGFWIGFAIAK